MNIFAVNSNPMKAASMLCDKHVVKMFLESAQLLCTAHRLSNNTTRLINPITQEYVQLYKPTHKNHPCVRWLLEFGDDAYIWLFRHMFALEKEYKKRYQKLHKTQRLIDPLSVTAYGTNVVDAKTLAQNSLRESIIVNTIPQCMPDQYKVPGDTVQAYRNYYNGDKSRFAKWKYSEVPSWFNPNPIGVYNA